jgi:transaldolase
MKGTQHLRDLGQRLWLDNITRDLLSNATHRQYIDELAVTFPATATRIGWQEE